MKQTTVRLPPEVADAAEAIARVRGSSFNQLVIESLEREIERAVADDAFLDSAEELIRRETAMLGSLVDRRVVATISLDELTTDAALPTPDDVSISADGRRLDSPEKLRAFVDEINAGRE